MKIKEEIITRASSEISIVDVIENEIPGELKKRGTHYVCCCPFHNERTPSFHVFPGTNTYKCFGGCGKYGDPITFIMEYRTMDFPSAVTYLIKNFDKTTDVSQIYEDLSPDKMEEYRRKETMYIYMKMACEFYRAQYEADNEDAAFCRSYAQDDRDVNGLASANHGRWPVEIANSYCFGYAPKNGYAFVEWAKAKGLHLDILKEIGLVAEDDRHPGRYYDVFRNRLMIPQRTNAERIVTFTARLFDAKKGDNKYINTKDSLIYTKGNMLFGLDVARKPSKETGKMYLLEGAPDVLRLHSLDIRNAVACLGGNWTAAQLALLSAYNPTLCFIPDEDVPKEGEKNGQGVKNVMRGGRIAVKQGFKVNVRSIPTDGSKKEDADSYLTDMNRWNDMSEQDFILWYAEKVYDTEAPREEKLAAIDDICDILVYVEPKLQASLLQDLSERYKQPKIWKQGLVDASHRLQEQKHKKAQRESGEDLAAYRFYRTGKHYYGIDKNGHEIEWTNFVIKPLFLIDDEARPTRIFEIENEDGEKRIVELRQADVTNLNAFKERIEAKGNFRFRMKNEEYEELKAYMYSNTETAFRVSQIGFNAYKTSGFFAFANGIVYKSQWLPVDEFGMIRIEGETFYLPATSKIHRNNRMYCDEMKYTHNPIVSVSKDEYFRLLIELYGDNAIVSISYYLATLFRDVIYASLQSFPLLFIYGKKGSGKTHLAMFLTSLFRRMEKPASLESTTLYAMGNMCDKISNVLLHLDEFKCSLGSKYIDFLKGTYNSLGRDKKAADGDYVEKTRVDCGMVVTGQEMPTIDIALFERTIFLEAMKTEHTQEETEKFMKMLEYKSYAPTNITIELLSQRECFEAGWSAAWKDSVHRIKKSNGNSIVSERIYTNWAVLYATVLCMERYGVSLPFTSEEFFKIAVTGLNSQSIKSRSTDELGLFWTTFANARIADEIVEKQDYKIERITKPLAVVKDRHTTKINASEENPKTLLYMRADYCLAKVSIQAKKEGKQMIPTESLLSYLVSTSEFYGKKAGAIKFIKLDKQNAPVRQPIMDDDGNIIRYDIVYDQERPLVFDYDLLRENYEVDLHRCLAVSYHSIDNDEPEEKQETSLPF